MALAHNIPSFIAVVAAMVVHIVTVSVYFWGVYAPKKGDDEDTERSMMHIRLSNPRNFEHPEWLMEAMWPIIYIWQTLWLIYGLSTLCRTTPNMASYLYDSPHYMSTYTYVIYSVGLIFKLTWSFLMWTGTPSLYFGLTAVSVVAMMAAVVISHRSLYIGGTKLLAIGLSGEVWMARILLHNGLALMITWEMLETDIGISGMLMQQSGLSPRDSGSVLLGIVAISFLIYMIIDMFCVDKYSRYTITPYVMVMVSMAAGAGHNWYSGTNSVFALIILAMVACALFYKILLVTCKWKTKREPIQCSRRMPKLAAIQVNYTG